MDDKNLKNFNHKPEAVDLEQPCSIKSRSESKRVLMLLGFDLLAFGVPGQKGLWAKLRACACLAVEPFDVIRNCMTSEAIDVF